MGGAALPITGGCLCRAVRYAVSEQPLAVRTCWCRVCQYLGGGTASVNLGFHADAVNITGTLTVHRTVADSGNHMVRGFCPDCGTPVTSACEERPHLLFLRAGTLDDTSIAAPEVTIWTEAAPTWALISDRIPAYPRQVPPVGS